MQQRSSKLTYSKHSNLYSSSLTVTTEGGFLVLLPGGATGRADLGALAGTVEETTGLATSTGEATEFAVLVGGVADPVDAGVITDDLVHRINHNALVPLVDGVLGNPVGVQQTEGSQLTADTLLSDGLQVTGSLDLLDTGGGGLAVADTLGDFALAATTFDADTEDGEALLGLVSQTTGLIRTRSAGSTVDSGELTVLPGANTAQKGADIRLLLLGEFLEVLVDTHL